MLFNSNKKPHEKKYGAAIRFMTLFAEKNANFGDLAIQGNQKKGTLSIKNFVVITARCNQDMKIVYRIDKSNIKDMKVDGMLEKVEAFIVAFEPTFE